MKYAIVTIEWCLSKGILVPEEARKSIDGTKVILHYDFIAPVITDIDNVIQYQYDSEELNSILTSSDWTTETQEENGK